MRAPSPIAMLPPVTVREPSVQVAGYPDTPIWMLVGPRIIPPLLKNAAPSPPDTSTCIASISVNPTVSVASKITLPPWASVRFKVWSRIDDPASYARCKVSLAPPPPVDVCEPPMVTTNGDKIVPLTFRRTYLIRSPVASGENSKD